MILLFQIPSVYLCSVFLLKFIEHFFILPNQDFFVRVFVWFVCCCCCKFWDRFLHFFVKRFKSTFGQVRIIIGKNKSKSLSSQISKDQQEEQIKLYKINTLNVTRRLYYKLQDFCKWESKHQIPAERLLSLDTSIYGEQGKFRKTVEETGIALKSPSERETKP